MYPCFEPNLLCSLIFRKRYGCVLVVSKHALHISNLLNHDRSWYWQHRLLTIRATPHSDTPTTRDVSTFIACITNTVM